jgi:two-component system, chemotaxis family, CheB/CheR fusion protein
MISPLARQLLRLADDSVGRLFAEVDERLRPINLRIAIEDARATGRAVQIKELQLMRPDDRLVHLVMDVQPVHDARGGVAYLLLWGHDRSYEHDLTAELAQLRQELETTNEELQTTNEELETTNEELQSTNEELETTNEELQSTNEELETTIEELQSTNEELEAANDELRARQLEMNALAEYQDGVLSSLRFGLIVVNEGLVVTSWNRQSSESWGIRDDEAVGQVVFGLDIGLDLKQLAEPLQRVIRGGAAQEVVETEATDRRGRPTRCRIRMNALESRNGTGNGAVLIVEPLEGRGEG